MPDEAYGITEFVTTAKGFSCIFKHRYEDFHVHEIGLDGTVVHLTSLEPESVYKTPVPDKTDDDAEALPDMGVLNQYRDQLQQVSEGTDGVFDIPCELLDKEGRTEIHVAVNKHFPKLGTGTVTEGGVTVIRATKGGSGRRRKDWTVDTTTGETRKDYCHFTLFKENRDSFGALNQLSWLLRCNRIGFGIAGTKDRRAITTQRVSVYRQTPFRLAALNKVLRGMRLGDFEYRDNYLKLGDSRGNRFTVVLRNITATRDEVTEALEEWKSKGFFFVNYFGSQRFGTTSVSTHSVGKELLAENWKGAVDLLLEPREGNEDSCLTECRKIWGESRDVEKCLKVLSEGKHNFVAEENILYGLQKYGQTNYFQALKEIPRQQLSLYVHSYQSFVWNKLISRRVQKYGMTPIKGDLVCTNQDGEGWNGTGKVWDGTSDLGDCNCVAYPLPYPSAVFPDNEIRTWYDEILAEDGRTLAEFGKRSKDWALGESYRPALVALRDVEHALLDYTDANRRLVDSDLDVINARQHTSFARVTPRANKRSRFEPLEERKVGENTVNGGAVNAGGDEKTDTVKPIDEANEASPEKPSAAPEDGQGDIKRAKTEEGSADSTVAQPLQNADVTMTDVDKTEETTGALDSAVKESPLQNGAAAEGGVSSTEAGQSSVSTSKIEDKQEVVSAQEAEHATPAEDQSQADAIATTTGDDKSAPAGDGTTTTASKEDQPPTDEATESAPAEGDATAAPSAQQDQLPMDETKPTTDADKNESAGGAIAAADDGKNETTSGAAEEECKDAESTPAEPIAPPSPKLALRVSFSLPAGSYATVALRELTKMDMCKQVQRALSDKLAEEDA